MEQQVIIRALSDINTCFSKLLLDSNYCQINNNLISWRSYDPGIDKGIPYAAVYQRLVDRRQYSFLLHDNSFFQFYFEWDAEGIYKAKLAYYPTPVKISGALESLLESAEQCGVDLIEELYFGAENWVSRGIDIVNTSFIRLDYDRSVTTHAKCHIQVASINELRVSSEYLINPFVFFKWIASHSNFREYEASKTTATFVSACNYHKSRNSHIESSLDSFPFLSNRNT